MNKLNNAAQFSDLQSNLFPPEGFKTKIILGDVAPKLVQSGAIDLEKFKQIYGDRQIIFADLERRFARKTKLWVPASR